MMPQSSVAVRMKISFSSSRILRERCKGRTNDEIGEKRGGKSNEHANRRSGIRPGVQIVAGGPGGDNGRDHQRAMGQVEDAGDTENQSEARRAERVQRTDRETVDQDL